MSRYKDKVTVAFCTDQYPQLKRFTKEKEIDFSTYRYICQMIDSGRNMNCWQMRRRISLGLARNNYYLKTENIKVGWKVCLNLESQSVGVLPCSKALPDAPRFCNLSGPRCSEADLKVRYDSTLVHCSILYSLQQNTVRRLQRALRKKLSRMLFMSEYLPPWSLLNRVQDVSSTQAMKFLSRIPPLVCSWNRSDH